MWSLKEAYIKAIGVGLGFPLQKASFTFRRGPMLGEGAGGSAGASGGASGSFGGVAYVELHGEPAPQWHFDVSSLDAKHCVSVALGPNPPHSLSGLSEEERALLVPPREETRFRVTTVAELLAEAVP